MIADKTLTAPEGGVRLDAAVLVAFPSTTRAFVREAIEGGDITIANPGSHEFRRVVKGYKLRGGEAIRIRHLYETEDNLVTPSPWGQTPTGLPKKVYEDEFLLAFDKPAGMPVQPLSCRETGTLMNGVVVDYPECRPLGDRPLLAGALHRIDADTSGLVLVARTEESFDTLRKQFSAQTVRKTYLAMVEGAVAAGATLENDLVHDPTIPYCRMIDARHNRLTRSQCAKLHPLHAVTAFRPLGITQVESEERTLLEVTIFTGVTHQIRAQLALAGMHIVNDRLYGAFAVENQTGHLLHALSAEFIHPVTGLQLTISTQLPQWAAVAANHR